MPTYISLLRGINVSGQKIVPMVDLKALFDKLGLKKAKTFIQSGNVVFESEVPAAELVSNIEQGIKKRFGFDVTVIVRTLAQLTKAVSASPYKQLKDGERVYISYLAESPSKEGVKALQAQVSDKEEFTIGKTEVYILVRDGFGNSLFSNNFLEKKLGVRATTRNMQSSEKLIALAAALEK